MSFKYEVSQPNPETVIVEVPAKSRRSTVEYMCISDVHWDNPKCDRKRLKKDLDYAVKNDMPIIINGDLFCLMQGKGDRRGNKSDIRPEHNNAKYLDSVVDTAVEWFAPYAEHIILIGYGNHETAIIKHQETDLLERFVNKMMYIHKPDVPIFKGGYGGWLVTRFNAGVTHRMKYYHGSGGGGPVTGSAISHNRLQTFIGGADVIWQGHVHESDERSYVVEYIDEHGKSKQKECLAMTTPTYKEEYDNGSKGFHVERRAPPKILGGRILEIVQTPKYLGKSDKGHSRFELSMQQRSMKTLV